MKKVVGVNVKFLDESHTFAINPSITGCELLQLVCEKLNTIEYWWFGLYTEDQDGVNHLVENEKSIKSQKIRVHKSGVINAVFKVLYYPEDFSSEIYSMKTKEIFYKSGRNDIVTSTVYTNAAQAIEFAGLHCQFKFGDYHPNQNLESKISDNLKRFIPPALFERHLTSEQEWVEKIVHTWKHYTSTYRPDAMCGALKKMQILPMYGVNYFEIKNKKGSELLIGITGSGINIYVQSDMVSPKIAFIWNEVNMIKYEECKFVILPRDKKTKLTLYSRHYKNNSIILDLCIGNYKMYRRRFMIDVAVDIQREKERLNKIREMEEREKLQFIKSVGEKMKDKIVQMENTASSENNITIKRLANQVKKIVDSNGQVENATDEEKKAKEIYSKVMEASEMTAMSVLKQSESVIKKQRIKTTSIEEQHEINQIEIGSDKKFQTIKAISVGNTKARIDQFEAL